MEKKIKLKKIQKALPSKSWCPQILNGLSIRQSGLYPCCEYEDSPIKAQSIEEYKSSPTYKQLLNHMKQGTWAKGCYRCQLREADGQHSQRIKEVILHLQSITGEKITDVEQIDTDKLIEVSKNNELIWLNIQPTNKCNQACVMCSPFASSKLEEEKHEFQNEHWITNQIYDKFNYDDLSSLCSARHSKGRIYLSGGEPTIMRDTLKYLESIDNPENVGIGLNSNFQVYNEKFWNVINKFGSIHILCSIDAAGERIEYQRGLSKWKQIEKNLLKTRDFLGDKANFSLNPTWTIFSSFYANELASWAHTHDFIIDGSNICHFPQEISITKIHDNFKQKLLEEFDHYKYEKDYQDIKTAINNATFSKDNFKKLIDTTDKIKSIRNQDYRIYFPKVANYVDEVNKYL